MYLLCAFGSYGCPLNSVLLDIFGVAILLCAHALRGFSRSPVCRLLSIKLLDMGGSYFAPLLGVILQVQAHF